jgi:hypothetical protein
MKVCFVALALLLLSMLVGGCAADGSMIDPSVVNTRYTLTIDGRQVDLGQPTATKLVTKNGGKLSIGAEQNPGMGSYIQGSSVSINDNVRMLGSFECNGATSQAQVTFGDFFGYKPTSFTECNVIILHCTEDRVVGMFSAIAHGEQGNASKVEGEFDVPIKQLKL